MPLDPTYQAELLLKAIHPKVRGELLPLLKPELFDEPLRPVAELIIERRPAPRTKGQLLQAIKEAGLVVPELPDEVDLEFDKAELRRAAAIERHKAEYLAQLEELERADYSKDDEETSDLETLHETPPRVDLIPTGLPSIDELLGGGLGRGELAVIMGPTNTGKSSALTFLVRSALFAGKRVGFVVLEQGAQLTKARLLSCLGGCTVSEIIADKKLRKKAIDLQNKLQKQGAFLKIIEGSNQELTHAQLRAFVSRLSLDVLFIDPGDNIRRPRNLGDRRHENTEIWEGMLTLAQQAKIPVWASSQTNRGSFKKTRVELSDVADNVAKVQLPHVAITLSTLSQDEQSWTIAKNRFGPRDQEVIVKTDWGLCRFFE